MVALSVLLAVEIFGQAGTQLFNTGDRVVNLELLALHALALIVVASIAAANYERRSTWLKAQRKRNP